VLRPRSRVSGQTGATPSPNARFVVTMKGRQPSSSRMMKSIPMGDPTLPSVTGLDLQPVDEIDHVVEPTTGAGDVSFCCGLQSSF
jgi:hypothetical protein